jgi:hypothetical protein
MEKESENKGAEREQPGREKEKQKSGTLNA